MSSPTVVYGNAGASARNLNAFAERLAARLGVTKGDAQPLRSGWSTQDAWKIAGFAVAFWAASSWAMSFGPATAGAVSLPTSILLCTLLLARPERWWMFVAAALPLGLISPSAPDQPAWFRLATFAIGAAEAVLAAASVRRFVEAPARLSSVRQFMIFGVFAAILAPAITAFGAAALVAARGGAYWPAWLQWFRGNAVGYLVLTPALFWCCLGFRSWRLPHARRLAEGTALAVGLVVTAYLVFAHPQAPPAPAFLYAPLPFLIWAALRFGIGGVAPAVVVIAAFSFPAAVQSHGPFAGQSASAAAGALQAYLLVTAAPFFLIAALVDEEAAVRRSLGDSAARFDTLAEATPVMVWMSGSDQRRRYLNQHWAELTGRTLDAHDGDGWIAAVHPDDQERVLRRYRDACDTRQAFSIEYRLRQRDGQFRRVVDRGAPCWAPDGALIGYMGSCTDVIERRRIADHQIDLAAHADRVASMGQLASALAHELNQPLGAILRNAEAAEMILDRQPLDYAEVRAILSDIRKDDQRAGAVIDRMRAMLKRRDVQFEALSVRQLLDQVTVLLRNEMLARHVTMQVDVPPDIPLVRGDRVHLQQVLINLLFNGADAVDGSRIEQRMLYIRARAGDRQSVEVSVHDTGHGVPEDHLTRLFEPFFTTKTNGMGMGMAIAKAIVESHGGAIWAENNPEGGATFSFTLRAAPPEGSA